MMDMADQPIICSAPYQMNLIDPGNEVIDVVPAFGDLIEIFSVSMDDQPIAAKIANWTIVAPIAIIVQAFATIISRLITFIISRFYTMNAALASEAMQRSAFNLMNGICFGALDRIKQIWDYQANYGYPIGLPTPSEAGSAWLANTIDECTFQTYVMSGNMKYEPFKRVVTGSKWKFSALELMTLDKREQLQRSDITTRLRELGSLETTDVQELEALFDQVPGPADLIRFMVRDTSNNNVVNTFGLDDGFTDNFSGQIVTWAEYQGLSSQVMTHEWRAHWSIPSPTQLYEMLHRLRHNPAFGGVQKVTDDVTAALKQQDILPYWIPKLMAVSYHSLTRTDLFRAYEKGWIDDDAFKTGMYNNGYSDDDSLTLLRFAKQERLLALRTADFTREYTQGYLSESQLSDLVEREGYDPSIVPDVVDEANYRRTLSDQRRNTEAVISQFRACRITEDEAYESLDELHVPREVSQYWIETASLKSMCGTRREWQSTLCSLLTTGDITQEQYIERMTQLKYDDIAIMHYLTLCNNRANTAKAKAQLAAQKAEQKAENQEARQQEQAAAKAARQAAATAKALAAAERSRQARNKAMEDAAMVLGQHLTDATGPVPEFVQGLYNLLQVEFGLSQNEAVNVIKFGSGKSKGMSAAEFSAWAQRTAQAGLSAPWYLYPDYMSAPQP